MNPYLIDHPPRSRQYRTPRRATPSGLIVVHTSESAISATGLEVARFIATRTNPGSYHLIAGHRSWRLLVPFDAEAFGDGTGSNRHAIHLAFACRAVDWPNMAPEVRDGFLTQGALAAADAARWVHSMTGVTIPSIIIPRPDSEARHPGFISHAARDPLRRTDPGMGFPWKQFLARYAAVVAPLPRRFPMIVVYAARGTLDADTASAVVSASGSEVAVTTSLQLARYIAETITGAPEDSTLIVAGGPAVPLLLNRPAEIGIRWTTGDKVATVVGTTALDTAELLVEVGKHGWLK